MVGWDFAKRAESRETAGEPCTKNFSDAHRAVAAQIEERIRANSPTGGRDGRDVDLHNGIGGGASDAPEPLRGAALASGVTEPGTLEQQAWNLYYDRHAKVAEEIVESLIIFAAPLRERVAELELERDRLHIALCQACTFMNQGDMVQGHGIVRAALSPDSQDGKKGMEG